MDRDAVAHWVDGYEQAWRTAGTDALRALFAADVTYRVSPWAAPVIGLDALADLWEDGRDGPDESFTLVSEVVAVDGQVAVVRVSVDYVDDEVSRWRDLWVLRFDEDGRCSEFEEWPFAPDQPDGHEADG
jgi:ketosteroid isomerase-like protein